MAATAKRLFSGFANIKTLMLQGSMEKAGAFPITAFFVFKHSKGISKQDFSQCILIIYKIKVHEKTEGNFLEVVFANT